MGHRILVVDDDPAMRIALGAMLAEAGYDVITSGTLAHAMQVLTDQRPHLLVTDIRLKGYNGLQLVALNPAPIPAIVLTGFPDRTIEAEARRLGAEYLQKPVERAVLLAVVRRLLGGTSAQASFMTARRWARTPLPTRLPARAGDVPARVIDISYGGLRLEIERAPGAWLPPSFNLTLPASGVAVPVDLVWQKRTGAARWICGAAVADDARVVWRTVVDGLGASG